MANIEIRNRIETTGLKHWQIAEKAGISEATFCIWLRHPLTEERLKRVNRAIDDLLHIKTEVST